jgi:hypothetical protein
MDETVERAPPKSLWGPWSPSAHPYERVAQLRCIRTLVHVFLGSKKSPSYTDTVKHLEIALKMAELQIAAERVYRGENDALLDINLDHARLLFDALPAARQRDIIATFAVLHKPLVEKPGED